MTFAFGHLIGAWVLGKGFEYFGNRKLNRFSWFFLLLGGILPDADFLLEWIIRSQVHRSFTHSFLFVLLAGLSLFLILSIVKSKQAPVHAWAFGSGIIVHLLLDGISGFGIPLFWPSMIHYSLSHVGYLSPDVPGLLSGSIHASRHSIKLAILDMAMGTAWIFWLWWRRRIKF
jgi:membrane-bound metal-dependent hydrolase YbcI (DUF457 family)